MKKLEKVIYVGDNTAFANQFISDLQKFDINVYTQNEIIPKGILNTESFNIVGCINELEKIEDKQGEKSTFDAYIIQTETKFKDRTSYSDSAGLELAKRILLCENLKEKRKRLIICLSFFKYHYHLKKSADNAILFAPQVKLMDIILNPKIAAKKIQEDFSYYDDIFIQEDEDFEKNLNPYIIITQEEKNRNKHDQRNFQGIQKLYRELLPNDNYLDQNKKLYENNDFKKESDKLYSQKIVFKHKVSLNDKKNPDNKEKIGNKTLDIPSEYDESNKLKILLIDDISYWKDFFEMFFKEKGASDSCEIIYMKNLEVEQIEPTYIEPRKESYKSAIYALISDDKKRIEEIKEVNYDMVLLDVRLKENENQSKDSEKLSGIELLKKLKEVNKYIPVIMLTASENSDVIRCAYQYGCDGYFVKETDSLSKLIDHINNNLKKLKLKKQVGELIYFLETEDLKIPKLCKVKDDPFLSWDEDYFKIREMSLSEKTELKIKLEKKLIECNESCILTALKKAFLPDLDDKNKLDEPKITEIIRKIKKVFFKKKKKKRNIDFNDTKSDSKIIEDFKNRKIVEAIITSIGKKTITVKLKGTNTEKKICKKQVKKAKVEPSSFEERDTLTISKKANSDSIVDFIAKI